MELNELFPKTGKLLIKSFDKEYELRSLTLRDEIWLKEEYGDSLAEMFSSDNIDMSGICRLAYRLIADKKDFAKQEFNSFDDNGESVKYSVGGVEILSAMITTEEDKIYLINAVAEVVNNSRSNGKEEASPKGK